MNFPKPGEVFQPHTGKPADPLPPVAPARPPLTQEQLESHSFTVPRRVIGSQQDLEIFIQQSDAYQQFIGYITRLSESVKGRPNSTNCVQSPVLQGVTHILSTLLEWVGEIEPVKDHNSRFGNPAFRAFIDRVTERIEALLVERVLPQSHARAALELKEYLVHCFGDKQRIDFGTGHEAHFIAFMFCLERIGLTESADHPAVVLHAFRKYMDVMRALQLKYWLEPAGSHGVWGLDDYHFLPFLFGSSQLIGHKHIKPKSILSPEVCDGFAKDYMYLACIKFVNEVKTETLAWHSPMLYDITAVKTWDKVNEGMLKMYRKEVLGKLPIMQHFRFGSLIEFSPFDFEFEPEESAESGCGHEHGHSHAHETPSEEPTVFYEHATCCISHLPSAIAAKQSQQHQQSRVPTKTPTSIPFD